MEKRRSRFLNLEKARRDDAAEPSRLRDPSRFGAVDAPADEPIVGSRSGGNVGRFEEPEPELVLETKRREDQPFSRCVHCSGDSPPFAASCIHCGASFDTWDQRAFNEALWQERLKARAEEQSALRDLDVDRAVEDEREARRQREFAEALARDAAASARARLGVDPPLFSGRSPLLALLRSRAHPLIKVGAVALLYGMPLLGFAVTDRTSSLRFVLVLWLVVAVVLTLPPSLLGRRVRRGWWG